MAEWLKAHAWKACKREIVSGVRIPSSPHIIPTLSNKKDIIILSDFLYFCIMLIKKDFDQLKKILSDPEKAERLIAYNGPSFELLEYKKVNIENIGDDKITGTYTHSRYHYVIEFSRNTDNYIEYNIQTSRFNYWVLIILTVVLSFKHISFIAFPLIIFLIILLVNNQIKTGIYNRINKRWDDLH